MIFVFCIYICIIGIYICIGLSYKLIKILSFIEYWKKRFGNYILILLNKCGFINIEFLVRIFFLRCLEGVFVYMLIMFYLMIIFCRFKRYL